MTDSIGDQLVWFDDPMTRRTFQTPLRTVPALFATLSPAEKIRASVKFDTPFDPGNDNGLVLQLHGEEISHLQGTVARHPVIPAR